VNLVTVAQQAMLARRAVRNLEEKAIDADSTARRAKQRVDDAVDRRNKVRDEVRQKLGGAAG
jgi:Rps23 Pro-64 3,4-dihydroxylase Tpa1-like proline 4-hydroxylase